MAKNEYKYWDHEADDTTESLIQSLIGISQPGLYAGYDFNPTNNLDLELVHDTGIVFTDLSDVQTKRGVIKTPQGMVIHSEITSPDTSLEIGPVTATTTNPRIDLIVASHDRGEVSTPVTYSIQEGVAAANPARPNLLDADHEIVLGYLYLPDNCTSLTQAGVKYIKAENPHQTQHSFGKPIAASYDAPTKTATVNTDRVYNTFAGVGDIRTIEGGIRDGQLLILKTSTAGNLISAGGNLILPNGVDYPYLAGAALIFISEYVTSENLYKWQLLSQVSNPGAGLNQVNRFTKQQQYSTKVLTRAEAYDSPTKRLILGTDANTYEVTLNNGDQINDLVIDNTPTAYPDGTVINVIFSFASDSNFATIPVLDGGCNISDFSSPNILGSYNSSSIIRQGSYNTFVKTSGKWKVLNLWGVAFNLFGLYTSVDTLESQVADAESDIAQNASDIADLEASKVGTTLTWNTPTLNANWSTIFGDVPKYAKDGLGFLCLAGIANMGAGAGNPIFTLPAGFRPQADVVVLVPDNVGNDSYAMGISTSGVVEMFSPVVGRAYFLNNVRIPLAY